MTEKRLGPTPGVRLTEMSVKRELTVFYILVGTKRLLHHGLAPLVQLMLKLEGIFQLMPRGDRYLSVNVNFNFQLY